MNFRILRGATKEADKVAHQYARERLSLGLDFTAALREAFEAIQARPLSFARSEVAPRRRHIRWCKLRRFRYLVYFEVLLDEIVVLAVAHERRRFGYWIRRKV